MADEPNEPQVEPLIISPKQLEGMELCRKKKMVLFSGPRYSGKTCGAITVVCDHAWNTDRANIAIVSVSQSAGLDSGIWEDLISEILPKYMALGQGMKWVKKPFIAASTKKACLGSHQQARHKEQNPVGVPEVRA